MEKKYYFALLTLLFTVRNVYCHNAVFGTIKENTTWFLRNLSVVPAMTASLEYQVQYPIVKDRSRPIITFYYQGQDSPNFGEKCERDMYGQLRNEDLAVPLNEVYREKFTCYQDSENWHCQGKTKIQDFEPKMYSFSFCNECGKQEQGNLNGLFYNVTIYDESNKTSCVDLNLPDGQNIDRCERHYQYGAIPNQIGNTDLETAMFDIKNGLGIMDKLIDLLTHNRSLKELYQMVCLVVVPECLPEENKVVLPCKEDCVSLLNDCLKMKVIADLFDKYVLNCNYLPTRAGNICYSQYDVCGPPPEINHGFIQKGRLPFAKEGHVVQYACNDSLSLHGSPNSTCHASGEWTTPPKCSGKWSLTTIICVSVGVFTVSVLIITVTLYCCVTIRRKKKQNGATPLQVDNSGDGDPVINRSRDPLLYNEVVYE